MSSILPKNELESVNFCPSLLGQKFFLRFLGELKKPKSRFEINWPLVMRDWFSFDFMIFFIFHDYSIFSYFFQVHHLKTTMVPLPWFNKEIWWTIIQIKESWPTLSMPDHHYLWVIAQDLPVLSLWKWICLLFQLIRQG